MEEGKNQYSLYQSCKRLYILNIIYIHNTKVYYDPWGQIFFFFLIQDFVDFRKTISSIYHIKPHIRGLEAPIINILMKQNGMNIQRINKV